MPYFYSSTNSLDPPQGQCSSDSHCSRNNICVNFRCRLGKNTKLFKFNGKKAKFKDVVITAFVLLVLVVSKVNAFVDATTISTAKAGNAASMVFVLRVRE